MILKSDNIDLYILIEKFKLINSTINKLERNFHA